MASEESNNFEPWWEWAQKDEQRVIEMKKRMNGKLLEEEVQPIYIN